MIEQELLDYGFSEKEKKSFHDFDRAWSIMPEDEKGRKFIVNIRFYEFSKPEDSCLPDVWNSVGYFKDADNNHFFVEHEIMESPDQIFKWYENLYNKFECKHYKLKD